MTARRHLRVQLGDAYRQRMLEVALRTAQDDLSRRRGRARHGRAAMRPRWRRRRRAAAARRRSARPGRLYADLLRALQPSLDRLRRVLQSTAEAAVRAQAHRDSMVRSALGLGGAGPAAALVDEHRLVAGRHLIPTVEPRARFVVSPVA